jgi:hypothetical protein
MPDPFPSDPNSTNGSRSSHPDSNGHSDQAAKLPQDPVPQPQPTDQLSQGAQRDIRRVFLILLAIGLVLGVITAGGVAMLMNRLDLIGVPAQPDQ